MKTEYPGFHLWRHKQQPLQREDQRLPLQLWPEESNGSKPPVSPDPMDYGRVAESRVRTW